MMPPNPTYSKAVEESKRKRLENSLATYIRMAGLPEPKREYKGIPKREYRFDFAFVEHKVAVEVQGGVFAKGKMGHSSAYGIARDQEKLALAQLAGWMVIQVCEVNIRSGDAINWIGRAITQRSMENGE